MAVSNFKEELRKVKAFAFDVDGVLSRSTMSLHPSGEPMRTINIKDGYALQLAVKKGYPISVITGGSTHSIRQRFKGLGIKDIFLGASNKVEDLYRFLEGHHLDAADVLYMGDDLPDFEIMSAVGFPTCPADAVTEIKQKAKYISHLNGGEGCVRDVIEQVLRLHHQWMDGDAFHW
ncbi:MAG: HAD hydrolase family protein [Chlorobi bacterium]|nr:HAD hydrolase family protein [Chlorobiota bacterium]